DDLAAQPRDAGPVVRRGQEYFAERPGVPGGDEPRVHAELRAALARITREVARDREPPPRERDCRSAAPEPRAGPRDADARREHRIEERARIADRHPAVACERAQPVLEIRSRLDRTRLRRTAYAPRHRGHDFEHLAPDRVVVEAGAAPLAVPVAVEHRA